MKANNIFNIIIIICLILIIVRFFIEFLRYKNAPTNIKNQISFKGYPFLLFTNILFAALALIEVLLRIGFFVK